MLKPNGEFDLNTKFEYDKEWANEIYQELIDNQKAIQDYAASNNLEEKYLNSMNILKKRALQYDAYAEQTDEMILCKYFNAYNLMYEYTPSKNLWGEEKPFDFKNEFERISKIFGINRALANKVVTTPYLVPVAPENITAAITVLGSKVDFEWNKDNVLVLASKITAYLTAIQPLIDGNHRTSHAIIHYYLGKAGLPSILRKKHLEEHCLGFSIFEKRAIVNDDLNDLIAYFYYNILERQREICFSLGVSPEQIIKSLIPCTEDQEIVPRV